MLFQDPERRLLNDWEAKCRTGSDKGTILRLCFKNGPTRKPTLSKNGMAPGWDGNKVVVRLAKIGREQSARRRRLTSNHSSLHDI